MGGITIKDIAKVANVSYATVSRALSGKPGIGEETRVRIKRICEEMGYTPNIMARSLVVKSTNTFGIVVPDISNPFFSEMCLHLESYASQKGKSTILCNTRRDYHREENYLRMLLSQQVDGIIFSPFALDSSELISQYAKKVPIVVISDNFSGKDLSCVRVDNYVGTYNGTKYLLSLGHKRIALLGRRAGSVTMTNRTNGYIDAMNEAGLEPEVIENFYNASSIQNGYLIAKDYFAQRRDSLPTAIFAVNDLVAMGVIQAADECHLRIPEDISLLGFDNIMYSALPKIMLTTISQPKDAISRATVDLIMNMIENKEGIKPMDICIKPEIVVRDSCCAVGRL